MKKVFSVLLLVLIVSAAVWAQTPGATAPGPYTPPATATFKLRDLTVDSLSFQAQPYSAVLLASQYYVTEVDLYMHHYAWQYVPFEKTFFFLGGGVAPSANSFQGGFAARAFGGVIAAYYNGGFFEGGGEDNGHDDSDLSEIDTGFTWSDKFALMYANESIGAIRLDVLLPTDQARTHEQGEDVAGNSNNYFTPGATIGLEWGKNLGVINARFGLGFRLPDYTKSEWKAATDAPGDDKAEKWEGTQLALRAIVDWKDFGGETEFTFDFGEERKGDLTIKDFTASQTGYFHNYTNLYYLKTLELAESFSIKLRPSLRFQFYANEYKVKVDYDGYAGETSYNAQAPVSEFQFNPVVQIGAEYKYKKIALYAGTSATLFTINTQSTSTYTNSTGTDVKNEPSQWTFERLNWQSTSLNLAGAVNFNEKIGIEFGFTTPLLSIGMPGSNGQTAIGNPFQGTQWLTSGNLIAKFKL